MVSLFSKNQNNPVWTASDYSGSQTPDNAAILRSYDGGVASTYNGSYWVAYDDTNSDPYLFSAGDITDPSTYSDEGSPTSTGANRVCDFIDMSGIDDQTPYWLFMSDGGSEIFVYKSADLSNWASGSSIESGALDSPEDFTLQRRPDGSWLGLYEDDGQQSGVAVNAATCAETQPDQNWTDEGEFLSHDEGLAFLANPCLRRVSVDGSLYFVTLYEALHGAPGSPSEPFVTRCAWVPETDALDKSQIVTGGNVLESSDPWEDKITIPNSFFSVNGNSYVMYTGDSGGSSKAIGLASGSTIVNTKRNFKQTAVKPTIAWPTSSGDLGRTDLKAIDAFSTGGLSAYTGDTGQFQVGSGDPVTNGHYSLKPTAVGGYKIYSTNGLPYYPNQDDTYVTEEYLTGSANIYKRFFVQSNDVTSHYLTIVVGSSDEYRLYRSDSGTLTLLTDKTGLNIPRDERIYEKTTPKSDGVIDSNLVDSGGNTIASLSYDTSGDSNQYTDGGVGWQFGQDTGVAVSAAYVE